MSDFLHLVGSPVIEAFGWALVHFVWQGALLAGLMAALLVLLRRTSSHVRYVVQCTILSMMAACPLVTWWLGSTADERTAAASSQIEAEIPVGRQIAAERPETDEAMSAAWMVAKTPWNNSRRGFLTLPAEGASSATPPELFYSNKLADAAIPWIAQIHQDLRPAIPSMVGVWLLGVVLLSLRLLVGWRVVQRLRRLAVTPAAEAWQTCLRHVAARMRISRPVRLMESALIEIPTVIGWLSPVILIPASILMNLTPRQLEAVLAHELAHIRRHDYLVNLIQSMIETLLFYHPAVWWLSRLIRHEREHCCDDLALSLCHDRVTYVGALAALEELRSSPSLTVAATGGSLLDRVRRIAGVGPNQRPLRLIDRWPVALMSFMILGCALIVSMSGSEAAKDEPADATVVKKEEFHGTVRDRRENPVTGATVALSVVTGDGFENQERTIATTVTDEAGEFRMSVRSSQLMRGANSRINLWGWTSNVATDGFAVVPLQPELQQPVEMVLVKPMPEDIELVDGNGDPVRGTIERLNLSMGVDLILPEELFRLIVPQPEVNGAFRLIGYPLDRDEDQDEDDDSPKKGEWRSLRIQTADRGRQILMWHPTLRKDFPTQLLVQEPAMIIGRLTTATGTLPAELLQQTEIVLLSSDRDPGELNLFRTGIARVRCDSEGRFEVLDLAAGKPGAITLHMGDVHGWTWQTPRGSDGEAWELRSGEVTNIEVPLIRTRSVRGQLVGESGEPLPNIELAVSCGPIRRTVRPDKGVETSSEHRTVIRTDETGAFSVEVVPGSIYVCRSAAPGLNLSTPLRWPSSLAIALPDGGLQIDPNETPLILAPVQLTVLIGRVIDHEERPFKGLILASSAESGDTVGLNYSQRDGSFRLETASEPVQFTVLSVEDSDSIPFDAPNTETIVVSRNPLVLQVKPKTTGQASLPDGVEFLQPYPKLHGLSLDMTEPHFLEIVKQHELTTRKTVEGEKVTHHIGLGDGHTLIVMFDEDAKCSGIQRVRGEDDSETTIDPVKELASFQGTWCWDFSQPWTWPQPIGVGTDSNGRKSEKRWVIEGNQITWVGGDGQRVYVSFTIDPLKAPGQIEFTFLNGPHRGQKSIGIYESKGDDEHRQLCMTDPGADAPRPTDFSAGDFLRQSIIVIYRVPPPAGRSAAEELKRLQGVWQMQLCDSTNSTFGGTQQEASKWQWTIRDDEVIWSRQGDVWKLKLNVDPSKRPLEMDLTYLAGPSEMNLTFLTGPFQGARCQGIYGWGGVDGQSLMIAIQDPGSDAPRPTKFQMNSDVKTGLMILRPSNPNDAEREISAL